MSKNQKPKELNATKTKEPLTVEYAIENKFNSIDCIKYFNPDWSDEDCDFYLWENTAFPFNSPKELIEQLNKVFLNNN